MPVSMTIRDVPDDVRDELAARAARAGQSLQEHVRAQLTDLARRPTTEEVLARVEARVQAAGTRVPADFWVDALDAERR